MNNLFDIKGKVAVITGGSGILGRCMATYLCEQGVTVVVLGRRAEAGEAQVKELNENGGNAYFICTNVMDMKQLEANAKEIKERFGGLDILVNAAGGNMKGATIPVGKTFLDLDLSDFTQVVDLNLMGTVMPIMAFAPLMIEKGKGSIINFSSMAAFRPLTRVVGYSASKAAVTNFTKFMATEMATKFSNGIRVNAIAPGFFLTKQNESLLTNEDGSLTDRGESIIRQTPFGRFGEAEELMGALHYLSSEASKFVTGTTMVVDGGFESFVL
jgi:NAD(P)-dependent dehydrogenase (short-subunit alcohol dehydrogenase family)